jgi:hypothetical protein
MSNTLFASGTYATRRLSNTTRHKPLLDQLLLLCFLLPLSPTKTTSYHDAIMSTIRTIPSESFTSPGAERPSTPSMDLPRSHFSFSSSGSPPSTPTTTATLTPNGHHRAVPLAPPQQPSSTHGPENGYRQHFSSRPANPYSTGEVPGPQDWVDVKRSWWKKMWSWIRGWGYR